MNKQRVADYATHFLAGKPQEVNGEMLSYFQTTSHGRVYFAANPPRNLTLQNLPQGFFMTEKEWGNWHSERVSVIKEELKPILDSAVIYGAKPIYDKYAAVTAVVIVKVPLRGWGAGLKKLDAFLPTVNLTELQTKILKVFGRAATFV